MPILFANNAFSSLQSGITAGSSTISVASIDAARFPSPSGGDYFMVTVVDAAGNYEIMKCTGRSAAVLTVQRGQEGTTPFAFAAGAFVDLRLTKGTMEQFAQVSYLLPAGFIAPFAMNTPPTGWLKANGATVSRTTYATLFAAIGTTYGVGDGATTFHLPDLRGEFLRGWDDGRGIDLNRVFGSAQQDEFRQHNHGLLFSTGGFGFQRVALGDSLSGSNNELIENTGGSETRPRNIALLACIKF